MFEQTSSRCWIANISWNNSLTRTYSEDLLWTYLIWEPYALNTRREDGKGYSSIACVLRVFSPTQAQQEAKPIQTKTKGFFFRESQYFHLEVGLVLFEKCRYLVETLETQPLSNAPELPLLRSHSQRGPPHCLSCLPSYVFLSHVRMGTAMWQAKRKGRKAKRLPNWIIVWKKKEQRNGSWKLGVFA